MCGATRISGFRTAARCSIRREVPVTIRDPDKPIGTHVFSAVARTGAGLRWTAVTIDGGDSAKDALDRITIPQEVLDRIAPTASPRSSLIISDEPLHSETNYRTEFIVALNNQPQGGPAMRKPAPTPVARNYNSPYGDPRYGDPRGRGAQSYDPRQYGGYYNNYYQRQQGWW